MTAHFKLVLLVTAFGAAMGVGAQGAEPSGTVVPVVPDPNPAISPTGRRIALWAISRDEGICVAKSAPSGSGCA